MDDVDGGWRELCDDLGPARVVHLRNPVVGLEAIVVVDNTALGPAIGGVRMAPDITTVEVARLARAMTLKNAAAGLPHGGGKAGIVADPRLGRGAKESLIRAFAQLISGDIDYVPGPDMGTDETCMAWIHDEIGRSVGLPEVLGGIPLDLVGATGFGLAVAAEAVEAAGAIRLSGARVVVQGFGSVGRHAARFLSERGATIVAVADSRGGVHRPDGLDVEKLDAWKCGGNPVGAFADGESIDAPTLVGVDCEIWVPAARPDVLTASNVADIKAAVVLEGANIPATAEAEALLHERGVVVVPDFIANAGGVICAAVEYRGGTQGEAFTLIADKIRANTTAVLGRSERDGVTPRAAAEALARDRLTEAEGYRRHF